MLNGIFVLIAALLAGGAVNDAVAFDLNGNALSLSGSTVMQIDATSGRSSVVTGITTVTYGGGMSVMNLAGTLEAGESFSLFNAQTYAGAFSSVTLPSLPDTLQWNTANLSVNGMISVGQSPWGQWLTTYFTASQLADPSVSGDLATPNGDYIPNLLKYALGLNPMVFTPLPITTNIVTVGGSNYLQMTVTKNPAATDITYTVEVTGSLTPARWSAADTTVEVNNSKTLVVRDNVSISSAPSRFIHLIVTQQ